MTHDLHKRKQAEDSRDQWKGAAHALALQIAKRDDAHRVLAHLHHMAETTEPEWSQRSWQMAAAMLEETVSKRARDRAMRQIIDNDEVTANQGRAA